MMLITPVIVGAIIGAGLALLFGQPHFLSRDIVMGIIGAVILRLISWAVLESKGAQSGGFSFVGILASIIGSALLVFAAKFFPPEKHDTKI